MCLCGLFAWETLVSSLIQRTFVKSAEDLTPEKPQGGRKAQHVTVAHPLGDHAQSCLTLAFESGDSRSVPLTVFTRVCSDGEVKGKVLEKVVLL